MRAFYAIFPLRADATESLARVYAAAEEKNIQLLVEPVSVAKARKLSGIDISGIFMITPNEDELPSICNVPHKNIQDCLEELFQRGIKNIWLRKGEKGSEIFNKGNNLSLAVPAINVIDSTGAGDAALAGWAAAHHWGLSPVKCLQAGHTLAIEVLQVHGAVITDISKEKLLHSIKKYYQDEQ